MPGGDRTGPEGLGRMTGRKMGLCTGNDTPGYNNPPVIPGRGYGRGAGRGFNRGANRGRGLGFGPGFRNRAVWDDNDEYTDPSIRTSVEKEIRMLRDQVNALEKKLSERNS